jgi:hypothetical protein
MLLALVPQTAKALNTDILDALIEEDYNLNSQKERAPNLNPFSVDIDQMSTEAFQTQTGSYLHTLFPNKPLSGAIKTTINDFLKFALKGKTGTNTGTLVNELKTDEKNLKEFIYYFAIKMILNEMNHIKHNRFVFYHSMKPEYRLYFDVLREFKRYESLKELSKTSPLRDKYLDDKLKTVDDLLKHFDAAVIKHGQDKKIPIYDYTPKSQTGYAYFVDNIFDFIANALSVNVTFFGNSRFSFAECTLFYFLTSYNIKKPDGSLLKNLVKKYFPQHAESDIEAKAKTYIDLFETSLPKTGGNLMVIGIPEKDDNDTLKKMAYMSFRAGVPMWIDQYTGKLATRGTDVSAIPLIVERSGQYYRPDVAETIHDYVFDSKKFLKKFSYVDPKNPQVIPTKKMDITQARLLVNSDFLDDSKVKIQTFTRYPVSHTDLENYYKKLRTQVKSDLDVFFKDMALAGGVITSYDTVLKRLYLYFKVYPDLATSLAQAVANKASALIKQYATFISQHIIRGSFGSSTDSSLRTYPLPYRKVQDSQGQIQFNQDSQFIAFKDPQRWVGIMYDFPKLGKVKGNVKFDLENSQALITSIVNLTHKTQSPLFSIEKNASSKSISIPLNIENDDQYTFYIRQKKLGEVGGTAKMSNVRIELE